MGLLINFTNKKTRGFILNVYHLLNFDYNAYDYNDNKTDEKLEPMLREIKAIKPSTIVIISSGGPFFNDAVTIHRASYGLVGNLESIIEDQAFIQCLVDYGIQSQNSFYQLSPNDYSRLELKRALNSDAAFILNQINRVYSDFKTLVISPGDFAYYQLMEAGYMLKQAAYELRRKVVVIISGEIKEAHFDAYIDAVCHTKVEELFELSGFSFKGAFIKPLAMAIGCFNDCEYKINIMAKENNTAIDLSEQMIIVMKDFENTVVSETRSDRLISYYSSLNVAPDSIIAKIAKEILIARMIQPNQLMIDQGIFKVEEEINRKLKKPIKNGIFITIYVDKQLRSCVGSTTQTQETLLDELVSHLLKKDDRFKPLSLEEINRAEIIVDLLTEIETVTEENKNPATYGIIVYGPLNIGLVLPGLPEIETYEQQIKTACHHGGFKVDEIVEIKSFSVERFT